MKILLTGGLGFVGTNLLFHLENDPLISEVVIVDHLGYTSNPEMISVLSEKFLVIEGSIYDPKLMLELISKSDVVINLAAETFVDNSISSSKLFIETNIIGTATILDSIVMLGCKTRLIHISTDEVWGEALIESFTEDSKYAPRNPYSATKAAADHLVKSYGHTYGLDNSIVHFSNLYGPWQYPEKLIPKAITNFMKGKKIEIFGSGKQQRTWLHVDDACKGVMAILYNGKSQESYVLGSDEICTNIDLIKKLCQIMDRKFNDSVEFVNDRAGHDFRYAVDSSKIRQQLGWEPQIEFETGLSELVYWFNQNQDWLEPRLKT